MNRKKPLTRKTPLKRSAFRPKPGAGFSTFKNPNQSNAKKEPKKRKPPKRKANQDFYDEWGKAHEECQCCGIGKELAERLRWPGLSTHHIAKAGRVHTATNIIRMCQRCHDCAEQLTTPVWLPGGVKWYFPILKFVHCHWLKIARSPKEYDAEILTRLRMGHLEEPEEPHPVFQAEWLARQGRDREAADLLATSDFPGSLTDLLFSSMQPK